MRSATNWQRAIAATVGQLDLEELKLQPPTEQLYVLVEMYEPLRPEADRFVASVNEQRSAQAEFYGAIHEAGNDSDNETGDT